MAIASAVVALSGILTGVDQALQPYNSVLVLLTAVVAVIAGGIGSLSGAFVMGIALTVLQSIALVLIPGRWSIAAVFLVFIAFILLRPEACSAASSAVRCDGARMSFLLSYIIFAQIFAIAALSTNLLVGIAGIFSVSQAAIMGIGAYAARCS